MMTMQRLKGKQAPVIKHHVKVGGCAFNHSIQKGFTLIELLVVIGILAVMASLALDNVTGDLGQQNFNQTQYKMKQIRKAILGSGKVVDGEPVLEGFVADMGRLPNSLSELLNRGSLPAYGFEHCSDTQYINKVDCTDNGGTWSGEDAPRFQWGWRGPYLNVFSDLDGVHRYHDAWGNKDGTDNFGWVFAVRDDAVLDKDTAPPDGTLDAKDVLKDEIELRSKGLNNVDDAFDIAANEYSADIPDSVLSQYEKPFPPHYNVNKGLLLGRNDFQINLEGKKLVFNLKNIDDINVFTLDKKLCTSIKVLVDGVVKTFNAVAVKDYSISADNVDIPANGVERVEFSLITTPPTVLKEYIPMGRIAISRLGEQGATSCDPLPVEYIAPVNADYEFRSVLPRSIQSSNTLATINWQVKN